MGVSGGQSRLRQHYLRFFYLLTTFFGIRSSSTPSFLSSAGVHYLSGNQTIVSKDGNFVLGFFSPGNTTTQRSHSYVGIWFGKVSRQTVVWVANRESPVSGISSSRFGISEDGNLVLTEDASETHHIWSTNLPANTSHSTVAVLLDSGNLVLRSGESDPSNVLWQSFDYPTDTWLPGAKVGMDKITGKIQVLTSWRNSEDPAPGPYSFTVNPNGTSEYFIQWNRSQVFWSSGIWNGQYFNNIPEMLSHYIYNFDYVESSTEKYFTYSVQNPSLVITRFVMDFSGQIKQLTWSESSQVWTLLWSQPHVQCDVYSLCGSFGICNARSFPYCSCVNGFEEASPENWQLGDHSSGCVRHTTLSCSTGRDKETMFYPISDVRLPDNPRLSTGQTSSEQCESQCQSNCSCTAYSYGGNTATGVCSLWYGGGLLNLQELSDNASDGKTLYVRLAASEFPTPKSKSKIMKQTVISIMVGVVLGFLVVFSILAIIWLFVRRRRAKHFSELGVVKGKLVPFKYSDLQRITKNFSEKLGGGGFGLVFKGVLPDSTVVAVKQLVGVSQGEKQFQMEVSTIGKIQHINLVGFFGFCSEGAKRLLVYEYMPRGSLDVVLFQNTTNVMDWKTRYQIALGIARGLAYLHEECRDCIIHCDVKPENILLDEYFVPKVADFGLAKLVGRDFSRVLTTIRGTVGYLAPEFLSGMPITAKADVYSYGMVLLELVSGQRNAGESKGGSSTFFPLLAASRLTEGKVLGLLDSRLQGDADQQELDKICKIACWCIQDEEDSRPTMGLVVQILEGVVDIKTPPIPRSLLLFDQSQSNTSIFSHFSTDHSSQLTQTSSSSTSQC